LQLLGLDAAALQATVREATAGFAAPKGVLWTADVDPWDMQ
jgi:hypothetical protein